MPKVKLTAGIGRESLSRETLKKWQEPCWIRYTAAYNLNLLGQEFDGLIGCDDFSAYRKYMKHSHVA